MKSNGIHNQINNIRTGSNTFNIVMCLRMSVRARPHFSLSLSPQCCCCRFINLLLLSSAKKKKRDEKSTKQINKWTAHRKRAHERKDARSTKLNHLFLFLSLSWPTGNSHSKLNIVVRACASKGKKSLVHENFNNNSYKHNNKRK